MRMCMLYARMRIADCLYFELSCARASEECIPRLHGCFVLWKVKGVKERQDASYYDKRRYLEEHRGELTSYSMVGGLYLEYSSHMHQVLHSSLVQQ